jgi:plastocyanin
MHRSRKLLATAAFLATAACSSHESTAPSGSEAAVRVQDNQYTPAAIAVAPGMRVTWTWEGANLHSVTFDDGPASDVQSRGSYDRSFGTPGIYPYHCVIHGRSMSGTVTVQ